MKIIPQFIILTIIVVSLISLMRLRKNILTNYIINKNYENYSSFKLDHNLSPTQYKTTVNFKPRYKNNNLSNMLFLIINMDKNKDRWNTINESFKQLQSNLKNKLNINYIRVPGIDGRKMSNNQEVYQILSPRPFLRGQQFICKEFNQHWIYDGSIGKSFPGLNLNGHYGTKGLTLSNLKAFDIILKKYPFYKWYIILEDDAIINKDSINKINQIISHIDLSIQVILIDNRGKGGAAGIIYRKDVIRKIIKHMHPLSKFSIENESKISGKTNLWDWKLWTFLDYFNIKYQVIPILKNGQFPSTIDLK